MDAGYIDTRGFDPLDTMLANTFVEAYKSPDDTVMEVNLFCTFFIYLSNKNLFYLFVSMCGIDITCSTSLHFVPTQTHIFTFAIFNLSAFMLGGGNASSQARAAANAAQSGAAL